jgi:hypothetical protein
MEAIKVVGHISIEDMKHLCADHCDECGAEVKSSFGDTRHKVERIYKDGTISTIYMCDSCYYEQFYPAEAKTIFD